MFLPGDLEAAVPPGGTPGQHLLWCLDWWDLCLRASKLGPAGCPTGQSQPFPGEILISEQQRGLRGHLSASTQAKERLKCIRDGDIRQPGPPAR